MSIQSPLPPSAPPIPPPSAPPPSAARPSAPSRSPAKSWLTKRNVAIAVVLIFLLLLAARGASNQGTITKTATVTTSLVQTVTVTAGANVAEYKAAMTAILSEVQDMLSKTSDNSRKFSNGDMSQADYLAFIREQKDNLDRLTESTIRLQPPQAFAEAHVHLVKAIALLYSAYQLIEDGLIQNNASLITEGTTFVNQANNEIETATSILKSTT